MRACQRREHAERAHDRPASEGFEPLCKLRKVWRRLDSRLRFGRSPSRRPPRRLAGRALRLKGGWGGGGGGGGQAGRCGGGKVTGWGEWRGYGGEWWRVGRLW